MKFINNWNMLPFFLRFQNLLPVNITIVCLLILMTHFSVESKFVGGMHLNYLIFPSPPFDFFIRLANGSYEHFGTTKNIILWLASRYNFTVQFVPFNQTLAEEFGVHEALFYQLINDKAIDGISSGFYVTLDRKEKRDFSPFFIWSDDFGIVVPKTNEESRLFAFIRPFQPMVWLFIFFSIIAIVGSMTFFRWLYFRRRPKSSVSSRARKQRKGVKPNSKLMVGSRQVILKYLGSHIMYVINIMTNQGSREQTDRHSFRILVGFWLLIAMVLVNSYSGIVISALTVPRMKKSIESLEDLAASEEVGVVLRSDVSIGEQILKATSGVYKAIGDKARSKPDQILADPFKLNAKLATGRYAYPFINVAVSKWLASQQFQLDTIIFFGKKASVCKGNMELWESGLTRFWAKKGLPKADECFAIKNQKMTSRQVPIYLYDLVSAFFILGVGIGLATLCFLLELVHAKLSSRSN